MRDIYQLQIRDENDADSSSTEGMIHFNSSYRLLFSLSLESQPIYLLYGNPITEIYAIVPCIFAVGPGSSRLPHGGSGPP